MLRRPDFRRCAAALCALVAFALPAAASEVNRIVLRVNDRIVTLHDYEERLGDRRDQISRSNASPADRQQQLAEAPQSVLRDFLDENLLLSRADQLDIQPTAEMMQGAEAQTRKNWGMEDDAQFRTALRETGMTLDEFHTRVRETLMYQEVLERDVMSQIKIGDEELQRYYREHAEEFRVPVQIHLKEIVVLESSGKSAAELEQLARDLAAQLQAGKTLEDLAAGGQPAGTTSAVIDLGTVEAKDVDPALAAAVSSLAAGGYSEPVRARGGWHLVQLVERQDEHTQPYEEVRDRLRARERSRRYQDHLADYMSELESKAYIAGNVPPEAQGFRRERAQVPGADPLDVLRSESAQAPAAVKVPAPGSAAPPPPGETPSTPPAVEAPTTPPPPPPQP
jgi:peptidyl-prolyl cis-trans isomerase SurA